MAAKSPRIFKSLLQLPVNPQLYIPLLAGGAGDGRLSTTSPASEQSDPAVTVGSGEGVEGEGVDGRALPMEDEEEEEGKLLPEKLPEDDAMRPPFYLRAIYTVFPALQKSEHSEFTVPCITVGTHSL